MVDKFVVIGVEEITNGWNSDTALLLAALVLGFGNEAVEILVVSAYPWLLDFKRLKIDLNMLFDQRVQIYSFLLIDKLLILNAVVVNWLILDKEGVDIYSRFFRVQGYGLAYSKSCLNSTFD